MHDTAVSAALEAVSVTWFRDICAQLSPLAPLATRLDAVPRLVHSLQRFSYSNQQLCAVWGEVSSLLVEGSRAAREAAFTVMDTMNLSQPIRDVGTLRVEFLHALRSHHTRARAVAVAPEAAPRGGGTRHGATSPLGDGDACVDAAADTGGEALDMRLRQRSLGVLIQHGKRIDPFADDVATLLVEWLDVCAARDGRHMHGYMRLLQHITRTGFYSLATSTVVYLIMRLCALCDHDTRTSAAAADTAAANTSAANSSFGVPTPGAGDAAPPAAPQQSATALVAGGSAATAQAGATAAVPDRDIAHRDRDRDRAHGAAAWTGTAVAVADCLAVFDVIIRFGVVPRKCLPRLLQCLCRRAGRDEYAWRVVHNLLLSECGHQSFVALLAILDDPARHRY